MTKLPGVRLRFERPFFKEFTLQREAAVPARCRSFAAGYHAGLPLGRWYPGLSELRQRGRDGEADAAEIDGLAAADQTHVQLTKYRTCASRARDGDSV